MIRIFLTGGFFQFLNAGLGILKVKYFLDSDGAQAMADVTSVLAIWGLIALMTEDVRQLFRTQKIRSIGLRSDILLGLKSNFQVKVPIIFGSTALMTTTDGFNFSLNNLLLVFVVLTGYVFTMSTSTLVGRFEAKSFFNRLSFLQSLYSVVNFVIFFPLTYFFSEIGFLMNVIISNNLLFCSLYLKLKNDKQTDFAITRSPLEVNAIIRSRTYLYVIGMQTCTYVFDPILISHFVSSIEAVEYSLIRRMGLILTVSTLSLGPYFSSLGTLGLHRVSNLTKNLTFIGIFSSLLYLGMSTVIMNRVFEIIPPHLMQYQMGMVLLGIASIKTSSLISSFSSDDQIYFRFKTLTWLVPLFLGIGMIGIFFVGGYFPLYSAAAFLIAYEYSLKVRIEKS